MSAVIQIHRTRYNTRSNPPPGLAAVLARLARCGGVVRKNDVRSLAKRADREYDDIGPADDLVRFLKNQGVLLQDGDVYYYDAERAKVVANACDSRTDPSAVAPIDRRLSELKEVVALAKSARRSASVADDDADGSDDVADDPRPSQPQLVLDDEIKTDIEDRLSTPPPIDDGFGLTSLVQTVQLALLDDQEQVPRLRKRLNELRAEIPGLQTEVEEASSALTEMGAAIEQMRLAEERVSRHLKVSTMIAAAQFELGSAREELKSRRNELSSKIVECETIEADLLLREPRLAKGDALLQRARQLAQELLEFNCDR